MVCREGTVLFPPRSSWLSSKVNGAWYNFALTGLQLNLKTSPKLQEQEELSRELVSANPPR